jgi:hypothetical protein
MSYWVGRFIHTDDGEHGRVLDRKILRRLSRRQLVELIEAKDVELVAWDEDGRLELVAEEYLADEGTHVSLSASAEAARPPRRPRTVFPVAVVVTCLALCASAMVLARVHTQASRLTAVPAHQQARTTPRQGGARGPRPGPSPVRQLILAPYPFPTVTRMSPSPVAVPSMTSSPSPSPTMTSSPSPSPTMVTTTTSSPSPWPSTSPTPQPSPSSPTPSPPATTPAPTPDPG